MGEWCGSLRVVCSGWLQVGVAGLLLMPLSASACERPVAALVAMEGVVETRAGDRGAWRPVQVRHRFCPGDQVTVRGLGRAAVVLEDDVLVRLDQHTTMTLPVRAKDADAGLTLPEGVIHIISRFRKRFGVTTPMINALVDGTEFVVVGGSRHSRVTVAEGQVWVLTDSEQRKLAAGEAVDALPGGSLGQALPVAPLNAVRWAIHYPQVLRPTDQSLASLSAEQRRAASRSMDLAAAGQLRSAFEALDGGPQLAAFRASLLLGLGRVDAAEALLDAQNADASVLAVRTMIQVARNDDAALATARSAVGNDPQSATAQLALSYALQGARQLAAAQAAARHATELAPDHPIAWARRAELELALAQVDAGEESARRALALAPDTPRAQAMAAFALLLKGQIDAAAAAFDKALAGNGTDPLAHFGRGLTHVRRGELAAGRRDIEIAVLLDPSNAELRSYLGRTYLAEERDKLAADQLDLARRLDPASPTPWYFDAFRKLQSRDFLGAIADGEEAVARNDRRAVLRAGELLDQDRAARAASIGDAYREAGLYAPMQAQAMDALEDDPQSAPAHRLLAEAYASLPRFETARLSELLQAQLRQPIGQMPLPPQFVMPALPVLDGPRAISPDEGSGFFARQPAHFAGSLLAGNQDSRAGSLVASHAGESGQISLGLFDYRSQALVDGQADTRLSGARFNGRLALTPQTMLFAELRHTERQSGDQSISLFDQQPKHLNDNVRTDLGRLAVRHAPSADEEWIAAFSRQRISNRSLQHNNLDDPVLGSYSIDYDFRPQLLTRDLELLYSRQGGGSSLILGLRQFKLSGSSRNSLIFCCFFSSSPLVSDSVDNQQNSRRSIFGYGQWSLENRVTLHGGAEYVRYTDQDYTHVERLNGKLGLSFRPATGTTLRAAVFQGVKGAKYDQENLEPTQFVGFNQSFDDFNGSRCTRTALAVDQHFVGGIRAGLELARRRIDIPNVGCDSADCLTRWYESVHRAYLVWPFGHRAVLSAEWRHEDTRFVDDPLLLGAALPHQLRTDLLPLRLWFRVGAGDVLLETWGVRQQATLRDFDGLDTFKRSSFYIANLRYSLPINNNKRLLASLTANNLFDRHFRFENSDYNGDPKAPLFQPRRSVLFQLTYRY
ncbi:MAG: FecR domain-containing protein [Candidatus Accumulibacter sp.]|nr:FecR domain-containing protein [Accumulibacter sp.]